MARTKSVSRRYIARGMSEKTDATPNNPKYRDQEYHNSRRSKEGGRLFPSFSHTRSGLRMTTYDDADYLTVCLQPLDHPTANSKTAFKNLVIAAYKEGRVAGNMKDIVTAQETAFSVLSLNAFICLFDLAYSLLYKELLGNPAEDDATGMSSTGVSNIKLTTLNTKLSELTNRQLIVPDFIAKMVRDLLFVVRLDDEWTVGSVQLPPSFFLPFGSDLQLTELDAFIVEWGQQTAEAKIHMDKFGIKYSNFDVSMISNAPEVRVTDPIAIAYFSQKPIAYRDAGPTQTYNYPSTNIAATATWTTVRYYFKDNPNEEGGMAINVLMPLFHAYDAANNPYGGMLSNATMFTKATQDYVGFAGCKYSNSGAMTELGIATNASVNYIIALHAAAWVQSPGAFNISITGTNLSADADFDRWSLAMNLGYKYGTGLTKAQIEGMLKTYIARGMYGQPVTAKGKGKQYGPPRTVFKPTPPRGGEGVAR